MHDPFQVWIQEGIVLEFSDFGYKQDPGCRAQKFPLPGGPKVIGVAEIEMGRKQNFLRKRGEMSIFLVFFKTLTTVD